MRNRINTTAIVRKLHFFTSIVIVIFCLSYVVSGYVLFNHTWFGNETATVSKPATFEFAAKVDTANIELLGNQIKSDFRLKGRMSYSKDWQGIRIFTYFMPTSTSTAKLNVKANSVEIAHKKSISAVRISKSIHTLRKFSGGIAYLVWGIFLDLTAVSFAVFSITGIIVWSRNRKVYPFGWYFLASGFIITGMVILRLLI